MLLLLAGLACRPDPSQGLAGRQARAAEQWTLDPAAVSAEIAAIADPVERLSLVLAVSRAHPGTTEALCGLLAPADRPRCEALNRRPHLRVGTRPPDAAEGAVAVHGPGSLGEAAARAHDRSPLLGLPAVDAGCGTDPDPVGCTIARAAAEPDPEGAAAFCNTLAEERWRAECAFQAAEAPFAAGQDADPALAGRGAALCLASTLYAGQCLRHLVGWLAEEVPSAGEPEAPAWPDLAAAIDAAAQAVAGPAPELGPLLADQAWAVATWMAVDRATEPAGAAIAVLPAVAAPHLRCALAWRLVEEGALDGLELAAAAQAVAAAEGRAAPARTPPARAYDMVTTWSAEAPGDAALARVHYLSEPVRLLAASPDADRQLCLLEAAARRATAGRAAPRQDWLDAASGSRDPALARTATRLGAAPAEPAPAAPPPRRPQGRNRP